MKIPVTKRIFDLMLSIKGLVCSAWFWAFIGILIILEDGFPVVIRQLRVGKNGELFKSYKFRSMRRDTLGEEVCPQAVEHDPRVTVVGRFLRRTALDELPQLINILLGDMSFVGPRPILPREVEVMANGGCVDVQHIKGYGERIRIIPGLTGIAQLYAPRDITREEKFKMDIEYISKHNFLLDIKLIFLSFIVSFNGAWEKRETKLQILKNR
ncbi:sugar transferase [candidate division WOR-3 bacterium]|nr:sugar transferase [candidate division WOR-3 bacterium]